MREGRIQELYDAHTLVGGVGRGRRFATEQLNWSITLRLASEFQGFVRDLHDEAADIFLSRTYHASPAFESSLRNLLLQNRQIDNRNATPSTLQQDFSRLGFFMLPEVRARYRYGATWISRLEQLNDARNGVAHDDRTKMNRAAGGSVLRLRRVQEWHAAVRGLTNACDRVTSEKLANVLGGGQPW